MKIFKCVLWVNCNILRELNKDMPTKATRHDEPFPIETKYIEIESYEKLRKTRPDIIFMLMPGYGNTGPYRDYRSMGMAIDAISGHSFLRGYPDLDHSTNSLVHHPDAAAAVNAVFALTTALIYRGKTGIGQFIDMSQAESFMTHM